MVPYGSREWAAEWKQSRKGGKKKINPSVGKLIPAKVMVGKGGKVRVFVNPRYLSNPTGWTIAKIKAAENKAKGYHFFDASTMKFFNSKSASERLPRIRWSVLHYQRVYGRNLHSANIKSVGLLQSSANISTVSTAHNLRQAEGDARSMAG